MDILPVCLHIDPSDLTADVKLIVTGWGETSSNEYKPSNVRLVAQMQTVPISDCNSTLFEIPSSEHEIGQYCANPKNGTCVSKSGGPLQFFNESNSGIGTIVGIVTSGTVCDGGTIVYTRVAYYLDWIETNVWPGIIENKKKKKLVEE